MPTPAPTAARQPAPVVLNGAELTIAELIRAARDHAPVTLSEAAWSRIARGRAIVDGIVARREPAYGITTGVGSQKDFDLSAEQLASYNLRLLAAHATRVPGPQLDEEVVRAAMVIMANLFATGACGVTPALVQLLLQRLAENRIPQVGAAGSVGASDLVPLAQLALGLMHDAPQSTFAPGAKEALSLMNSNAVSLGRGAIELDKAQRLLAAFDLAAAVALEGLRANLSAISEPVTRVHSRHGQAAAAARLRRLLAGSALWQPGAARFLQDPLSFRCVSQIHGTAHSALDWARQTWQCELNAITDNPLIDLESGRAVSHGNMDSTAMTLAIDTVRQILAKLADLSGERVHKQHWPAFSGLPTGLASEPGALGGVQFLNLSHIAASLIASIKIWAQPALLHSIGQLADGVEDTAGLAMHAVGDLMRMVDAGFKVATLEMIVGTWAIHRRGIALADLGVAVRPVVETLLPCLPIGREGDAQFDLAPLVARVAEGGLVEEALAQAGCPLA